MVLTSKLLTELVGTFLFFTVIALAGPIGPLAPLAIGGALMAMVYMGGHVSGAHYNPAVSLAVFLRRKIGVTELLSYWAVQLVAAALAFSFGYLVSGKSGGIHPGAHVYWLSAMAIEAAFTMALATVVLNVAATEQTRGNSFYGLAIGIVIAMAVFALVPKQPAEHKDQSSPLSQMAEVFRLALSRPMRGIIALALVSLASTLVIRGVWGGPWLMDVKGLSRIQAGNQLGLFTLSMIIAPVCTGILDRRFGHPRLILATGHLLGALCIALVALGGPDGLLSRLFQVEVMPPQFDSALFVVMGFVVSTHTLLFAMTTQLMGPAMAGRGLAATNLSLFLGTALLQSVTGVVATLYGLPDVMMFVAAALATGALTFIIYTKPALK